MAWSRPDRALGECRLLAQSGRTAAAAYCLHMTQRVIGPLPVCGALRIRCSATGALDVLGAARRRGPDGEKGKSLA